MFLFVVIVSAGERLVSKVTCYMSSGTLSPGPLLCVQYWTEQLDWLLV